METAKNVANTVFTTATKLLYGEGKTAEPGEEPVAGDEGKAAPNPTTETKESIPVSDTSNIQTGSGVTCAQKPEEHAQGAGKPQDEPAGAQKEAIVEQKDEGEAALAKRDPDDHSGEPLKMHDGSEEKATTEGGEEGFDKKSTGEGTGEQWVKTTGLAADGGDFDAAKPGAAKEADRILEEKGIKRVEGNTGAPQDLVGESGATTPVKTSKLARLKEKVHIGRPKS